MISLYIILTFALNILKKYLILKLKYSILNIIIKIWLKKYKVISYE